MESTGVSWQPGHAALEDAFTLIVGNAAHMCNVPGRKTDVKDAKWTAGLIRHGLVQASFVPPPPVRVLRELVRHRKALAGTLAAERNRTLKLLESAGIKLAGVMSDVFGVSGMLMLKALAEGVATPVAMAELARRRLRRKIDQLALALDGHLAEHQRRLLRLHLRRLEEIGRDLTEVEAAITAAMRPFAAQQALLMTIPGVNALTAAIIAEIGVDMAGFGTARRLAAWAGVCPANHESAGKRKQRGTRKGNTHLKATLVTAAISASQAKGTYLRDKFHRLKARMTAKKAAMAVAHKILVAVFHMLQRAVSFAELGADYLDRLDKHRTAKRLVRRLDALGYDVMLRPKTAG
jgi:transposase